MKALKLILIAMVFFLVGCPGGGQPVFVTNYKTGVSGLEARFIQSAPPNIVFSDSPFQISLELRNRGGYNIEGEVGTLNLITDLNTQLTEPPSQTFSAEGRNPNNPDGETTVKTFQAKAIALPPESDQRESIIQAQLCYPYKTDLSTDVCIDTDIENKLPRKPCKLTNPSFSGQGAPIAVTNLQTELIPTAGKLVPRFTLTVANKGSGLIAREEIVHTLCTGGTGQRFFPEIIVEQVKLGERILNCRGNVPTDLRVLRLDRGDKITCSYDQGFPLTLTPFTTPLTVTLRYGYFQAISKTIIVKK